MVLNLDFPNVLASKSTFWFLSGRSVNEIWQGKRFQLTKYTGQDRTGGINMGLGSCSGK